MSNALSYFELYNMMHQPDNFDDLHPPIRHRRSYINSNNNEINNLFDEYEDIPIHNIQAVDNIEMGLAINESFSMYKATERNPDIEINIEGDYFKECSDKLDNICVICQDEFEECYKITNLSCDHIMHSMCIEEWVKYKAECPVCRKSISVK